MRFLSLVFSCAFILGCTSKPPPKTASSVPPSQNFHSCFDESYRTWLLSVVARKTSGGAVSDDSIPDFVGGSPVDQARARGYLNDLRQKKYASEESMAGTHFNACIARQPSQKTDPSKAHACFKEQRIIFELIELRDVQGASLEQASQQLIQSMPSADGTTAATVRRLAKDTFAMHTPGNGFAFSAAQYQVCMTSKS